MRFISTKIHGTLDYLTAFLLLIIPFVLGYGTDTVTGRIFVILGVATILYSLITKYELGLLQILPIQLHLMLDVLSGVLLAASPWLFGFNNVAYMPHLIIGIAEISIALITRTKTYPGS